MFFFICILKHLQKNYNLNFFFQFKYLKQVSLLKKTKNVLGGVGLISYWGGEDLEKERGGGDGWKRWGEGGGGGDQQAGGRRWGEGGGKREGGAGVGVGWAAAVGSGGVGVGTARGPTAAREEVT